jgi:hypothetical protein
LLGFSGPRLLAIGVSLAVVVLSVFLLGVAGLMLAVPIWAPLIASAFVRWNGDVVVDAAPTLVHWAVRRASSQNRFRTRIASPRPIGTMALPGDAAALRFYVDLTGSAMIHDPHRQTLSAVVRVSHPAYVLLSPDDQARRVTAWSRVLAGLAASGSCAGLQILESTFPDPGHGVRQWFADRGLRDSSWPSVEYARLTDTAAPTAYAHRTLLTLSLDLRRAAKAVRNAGRGITGAAEVLRGDLTTFAASLRTADLHIEGWLGPEELAGVLREAYDPECDVTARRMNLQTAGPIAVDEHWDCLRHDSGYSAVLWISEWPRIDVVPQFLHSLVFLQDVRKSISIVAKPLMTGDALRAIRKEKVEYLTDAQQSARIGKLTDFASEQEYADVLARERALVSGHADLRFTGFVAVTASSRDELATALSAAERAANQCGCETRVLYGRQAQAFTVAALPLGRSVHP